VVHVRFISVPNAELRYPEACLYSVLYSRFIAITDVPEILYHDP
jgi:hypothetical protein